MNAIGNEQGSMSRSRRVIAWFMWVAVIGYVPLQASDLAKQTAAAWMTGNESYMTRISDAIWQNPEVSFEEFKTSELLTRELEKAGFKVDRGVAGMPTAFVASFGSGKPVIAILAELDALPGLSQKAAPSKDPAVAGGAGHGCQHNLVAASAVGTAMAVKEAMEKHKIAGTIKVFGPPAEEELIGKIYLVKAGLFADVDAVLSWHAGETTSARYGYCSALSSVKFAFTGPAGSIYSGDAPVLKAVDHFEHALDFLRKQLPEKTVISHPVYTQTAERPNIPPGVVEVWYYIRAPRQALAAEVYQKMVDAAKATARIAGVTAREELVIGTYERLPNEALILLNDKNLRFFGPPQFSQQEKEFAAKIQEEYKKDNPRAKFDKALSETVDPPDKSYSMSANDNGDVSWVVPLSSISGASRVYGDPSHTWVTTAASGMGIGHKVTILMAKTLAGVALDLLTQPEELRKVRAEFEEKTRGFTYKPHVPEKPPIRIYSPPQ